MLKKILLTLFGLALLIGLLGGIKALQISKMVQASSQFAPPPEPVNTAVVSLFPWDNLLPAVGTLSAVQGVQIAAELPGKVVEIAFEAGAKVSKGDLLLRQDSSSERAQLPGAEAALTLAEQQFARTQRLIGEQLISRAAFETAQAGLQQARAGVDSLRSQIAKKTIRAPFAGRLGIRQVNLGQVLREGDLIVPLQTLDPIFVDFQLPQQRLPQLRTGQPVRVTADGHAGTLTGTLSTISPQVDTATRSVRLQASLRNPEEQLRPGMFVSVAVQLPDPQPVLAIPATAVLYAPFGDSVFVVEAAETEGKEQQLLRQQFVRLGRTLGDYVQVTEGLKEGETVVSTGVFKLRNGQAVVVDNRLAPEFKLNPQPENN